MSLHKPKQIKYLQDEVKLSFGLSCQKHEPTTEVYKKHFEPQESYLLTLPFYPSFELLCFFSIPVPQVLEYTKNINYIYNLHVTPHLIFGRWWRVSIC